MLENRFNQIMFEFNIGRSGTLKRSFQDNPQFVLELMDKIYNGQNNPNYANYDYIDKLSGINYINLNMKRCVGSIISTTELAESILDQLEMNKDANPESQDQSNRTNSDKLSDLIKIFTSSRFKERVSDSNEAQDQVDSLFSCAGDFTSTEELSQEEIDIRNSIIASIKNKKYRSNLKTIMDCFGYFYSFANKIKKENFTSLRVSPTNVEVGNDIGRALPSELGYLDSEELLPVFVKKMINREILQFKYEGKENQGKGDIVVGLDISDSMNERMKDSPVPGASKLNVAIGFCLAMCRIMKDQGRSFYFFSFDTRIDTKLSSKDMPYYKLTHSIMNTRSGGGTDLETASKHGLYDYPIEADFVMVSDCEGDISPQFKKDFDEIKQKSSRSKRFSTLVLDGHTTFEYAYGVGGKPYTNLKGVCDSFILNQGAEGFKHQIEEVVK